MASRLNNPGIYLVLMAWWIVLFFLGALSRFPISGYFSSYVPFFVAFAVFGILGAVLGVTDLWFNYWSRYGCWRRYFILIGAYALAVFLCLFITLTLDFHNLVKYFGGCPAGSFGMLYIPSVPFYAIVGAIFAALAYFKNDRPSDGPLNPPCKSDFKE